MDIIKTLRERLVPLGTKPLVRLHLKSATFVNTELIDDAINELERLPLELMLEGGEPTALQKIAIMVLKDSAYLEDK
jgi:hypothetical protein